MTAEGPDLEAAFRNNGISVESVEGGDPLTLTYMTAFPADRVHHGEVGRVCTALIDLYEAGEWDPVRVEVTVVRSPGDVLGTWHAEPDWFEGLADYRLSEEEFSAHVLDTIDDPSAGRPGNGAGVSR